MATVDWSIRGPEINSCNCNWGCPCQFNSLPSHGHCRAILGVRIEQGHFGEVRLDGLAFVSLIAWPGPIHFGKGEATAIVDERADDRQRSAILTIMKGAETEPGATIFNIFAGTLDKVHKPRFLPIEFDASIADRTGFVRVPGVVEASVQPIRNPVTGLAHRANVRLPHGFEFTEAEFASGTVNTADSPISHHWVECHAHLAMLHLTPKGPVR
jgi:hypothetical protein